MSKKRKIRMITSSLVIISALIGWYMLSQTFTSGNTLSTLQYLSQYVESDGHVIDADGSIAVDGIEDIRYKKKSGAITIYFGRLVIPISKEELQDTEIIKAMLQCGLSVKGDVLYYFNEQVDY